MTDLQTSQMRGKIQELENAFKAHPDHMTQSDFDTKHYFVPGIYMRSIAIPKGVCLTGKIHKTEHMCILSQGEVSVQTEYGMKRLKASSVVHSKPGMKRVLYAHEDSVWINVHHNPSDEQDIEKVDDLFVVDTFEQFYISSKRTLDDVLNVLGKTHAELTSISENIDDQIPFPVEPDGISVGESLVHGKGVFATKSFSKGDVIAFARIGDKRTPVGRFCNHSGDPNSEMVMRENGDVDLVAIKEIGQGFEILSDYYFNYVKTRSEKWVLS
jgi:hypothetical protein